MSGANVSPSGRNQKQMSGANVSPSGRNHQEMSGANVSPSGRNHQDMSGTFTRIPKQIEEVLEKWNGTASRRTFLKSAGLLVVSVSTAASVEAAAAGFVDRHS